MIVFRDISELESLMTEEQKAQAKADFEKFHSPGTPVVMCLSDEDGEQYLKLIDLDTLK